MATPITQADWADRITSEVRNDSQPRQVRLNAEAGDFAHILEKALERFNNDAPREGRVSAAGDASTFEWSLPATCTGWVRGFSALRKVEIHSTDATERGRTELDPGADYKTEDSAADPPVETLRLLDKTPSATETVEFYYTHPHTIPLTGSTATLPSSQASAFAHLAAAMAYEFMGEAAISILDGQTGEDLDLGELQDRYDKAMMRRLKRYEQAMGLNEKQAVKAAATFRRIPTRPAQDYGGHFSHNLPSRERGGD